MIQNLNTLTVLDLKKMLAKIKALHGEEPVAELIEISEGFETAMSQYGVEEPQDHDRLLALLGLAWEMERRMKKIELTLENVGIQARTSPLPGLDINLMRLIHQVPNREPEEICE